MYEALINYLTEIGYFDLINDNNRLENFFQNLTLPQFKKIVIELNKKLRNLNNSEDCLASDMMAGDLVAPTVDIRDEIIENLIATLKKLNNNKNRALLIYYTMIDLHMFSDGNGRTSRLIYDLICNELGDVNWYIHDDKESHKYTIDFETSKGIQYLSDVNFEANRALIDIIRPYIIEFEDKIIGKYIVVGLGGMTYERSFVRDVMPPRIKELFTSDELEKIDMIMCDGGSENNTISGLTFLSIALQKGQLKKWIDIDDELTQQYGDIYDGKRLCFRVRQAPELLDSWTIEDYKNIIKYGNFFKLEQFRNLNNMLMSYEKKSELSL